jgi:hypothetical protein
VAAQLAAAAAPHSPGAPASARFGVFEGVRYETGRLAAAARARGLDGTAEVRAALARCVDEARLDAAARKLVAGGGPREDAIAQLVSARESVWTRPERVAGTKLFFALRAEAEDARRRLAEGATVEDLTEQLQIPPLSAPNARGKVDHYEHVTYDHALWQRVAPQGDFTQLTQLAPGATSEILDCANGFVLFAAAQALPREPVAERAAHERAGAELRRQRAEATIETLLWMPAPTVQGAQRR